MSPDEMKIARIYWAVREGAAEPNDALWLMEYFSNCVDENREIPRILLQHFSEVFTAIRTGHRYVGDGRPQSSEAKIIGDLVELIADLVSAREPRVDPEAWCSMPLIRPVSPVAALGLAAKRGNPGRDNDDELVKIKAEVLWRRIGGERHQNAVAGTAQRFGVGISKVSAAWNEIDMMRAKAWLELEEGRELTGDEQRAINEILAKGHKTD